MYPQSFLCEEAKIKQRTSSKKEFCEIGEQAMWESRFTCFLLILQPFKWQKNSKNGKLIFKTAPIRVISDIFCWF